MRKKGFNFSLMLSAGVLLFGAFATTACSGNGAITLASVRLNKSSLNLEVGEDTTLKVSVSKEYKDAPVYWTSTNENVALVIDGHVMAVGVGQCEIQVYVGGGRDVCAVTVTDNGGGGETDPYLRVSPTNKSIAIGSSFKLTYSAYPSDTTVEFASDSDTIATVSTDGLVKGISVGETTIRLTGSNLKTAQCVVTVTDSSSGGDTPDYDIGVDSNLGASGSFVIGSPTVYKEMTVSLLKDFNKYTNSSITWEIKDFEENTAANNLTPDASLGPDVFPYASDQTQSLNTLGALTRVGKTDINWIKSTMGSAAADAAKLGAIGTVGYPFASDNSYVMFYDKSKVSDPAEIDTLSELFAKAASYTDGRKPFKVTYDLTNGFYGGAALMSYSGGQSLYTYTPLQGGSYQSKSTFNSDVGLQGAKAVANIFANNLNTLDSTIGYPSDSTRILATITDCSKVLGMKQVMGSNYAVAPLPFIDDAKTTRLASFSGYKFYGVNNKKLGNDTAKKDIASAIAKFMVSEYAQHVRLETFGIRPTMESLQDAAASEPHVAALNAQAASAIPLSVVDSTFWAQTGNAVTDIKTAVQAGTATDDALKTILAGLDAALLHE